MKRLTVRVLGALLSALILAGALSGCSHDTSATVMTLGDAKVTANMYHYWASSSKGDFLYSYSDVKNTDEYWSSELVGGMTAAEYLDSVVLEKVKMNLVAMKLFDDYGLKLTSKQEQSIGDYISDLVKEYADGSKNMLNTALSEYGVNIDILKQIYIEEAKSTLLYQYLYGDDGQTAITDEEKEEYYQDNFVHFQMIFINNAYKYKTDSKGDYTTNDDGTYATEKLSESEAAEKNAAVAKVKSALEQGEDFDALYSEYSELTSYANGLYFNRTGSFSESVYYDIISAVDAIEEGQWTAVENDEYGAYIMKKLPLDKGAWSSEENSDFFSSFDTDVGDQVFRYFLRGYYDDITIDEEAIKEFSVSDVTPNYSF